MSASINLIKISEHVFSLDVRGYVCPYPELLTLKALQTLSAGDTLEVVIDNPPSTRDIPITLEKRGYAQPEIVRLEQGVWKIIMRART
ncbi:MAG: sulfurtransferase TusA family protein [Candidatus Bathyarchaeota archaeon]|jgi:tRNA 2-thiouridine synthesizing protein A|nr:sulfurtransferase TusA family protein [Candidatus Bathyarchaeota archaeon]